MLFLKLLHAGALLTPLANPPESLKSGNYGHPPRYGWWAKQSVIYFIGLIGMKLCVLVIFQLLPWIAWVGDWALRWTEGNTALQIAFVMLIFPLIMNALQYYIIDSFIKDKDGGEGMDHEEEEERERLRRHSEDDESIEEHASLVKGDASLEEANPTVVPVRSHDDYQPDRDGEHSRTGSRENDKM